jgi:hypothetical protein
MPPSYAWALRLSEPRYAGYLEERRRWVFARGGAEQWPRVLQGLEYAHEFAKRADVRRRETIMFATRRTARTSEELERLEELEEQRRWEKMGTPRERTPAEKFRRSRRALEEDADFARLVLFGSVSGRAIRHIGDRAIRHRLRVHAAQVEREQRFCTMANCTNELPRNARSTRKRCDACRAAGRRC